VRTLPRGPGALTAAQGAMLPFIRGAAVPSVIPMLPELVRTVVQRVGDAAFVVLIAIAASGAGGLNAENGLAALALSVPSGIPGAAGARMGGVDLASGLAGAGSRDPAVATAVAVALGGSVAVPLYAAILLLAAS